MDYVITFLISGTAATVVSWILRRADKWLDKREGRDNDTAALKRAIQALMYDRIKHIAKSYIANGGCTVEEYEDLKRLHTSYHNDTGGNGFLDEIMEYVKKLPKQAACERI